VGSRPLPGIFPWEIAQNPGARRYCRQLIEIADGRHSVALRVMAIRALGRAEGAEVLDGVLRWSRSAEPQIREAAIILLADFDLKRIKDTLVTAAGDTDPHVRKAAARAIGFGQFDSLLPILDKALHDRNGEVKRAAAESLVSFSAAHSRDISLANINDPDYSLLFIIILASEESVPYIDALCEIINKRKTAGLGGLGEPYASWEMLMAYWGSQKEEDLRSDRFNRQFDWSERNSPPPRSPRTFMNSI